MALPGGAGIDLAAAPDYKVLLGPLRPGLRVGADAVEDSFDVPGRDGAEGRDHALHLFEDGGRPAHLVGRPPDGELAGAEYRRDSQRLAHAPEMRVLGSQHLAGGASVDCYGFPHWVPSGP